MNATVSNLVEVLTPIWERALDSSPISAEDNFFDLGGDSILALKLFTEISKVCGVELPPVTIYEAPTIRALAAVLEHPEKFHFPALTLLKEGKESLPIFVTHGIGGNVMDFFQVVKHIRTDQPIYGLQSKGINGVEEPHERIEDMAEYFLEAVRERQPHGPYYLMGYSLGGLVVLEMAQRLTAEGEKIGLLVLLEAYPHRRYLQLEQNLRLLARRAVRHLRVLSDLPARRALDYLLHPAERLVYTKNGISKKNGLPLDLWFTPAMQEMRDRAYLGLKNYRPRFYSGSIKFMRAERVTDFPANAEAVWRRLAKEFESVTVPGDHLEIMNTHFELVGAALSRYLQQAKQKEGIATHE